MLQGARWARPRGNVHDSFSIKAGGMSRGEEKKPMSAKEGRINGHTPFEGNRAKMYRTKESFPIP